VQQENVQLEANKIERNENGNGNGNEDSTEDSSRTRRRTQDSARQLCAHTEGQTR